jgi:hypothetical protein
LRFFLLKAFLRAGQGCTNILPERRPPSYKRGEEDTAGVLRTREEEKKFQ